MFGLKFVKESELNSLVESVTLMQRQIEDMSWQNMAIESDNFKLDSNIKDIVKSSTLMYYRNPLAGHWVEMTTAFVFGEGISKPKAKDSKVQEIIDRFWEDPDNRLCMTSLNAQLLLSNKIQYEGNLFLVLFDDEEGNVRVRVMDTVQVEDIIKDSEDNSRSIFYKVENRQKRYNFVSDSYEYDVKGFVYYPDKDLHEIGNYSIPENKLVRNARIYHIKINTDINAKFGIPHLYRGIDWIKAHKTMAEDLATLVKALSKFAWDKKIKGPASRVASIQNNIAAKLDLSTLRNSAAQTYGHNEGIEMKAMDVKTGGVQIGVDGMRQMKLMICAASGLFEHYFGDPSTGNLATAKTMESPMMRKFAILQSLWRDIFLNVINYEIERKIDVGKFDGTSEYDEKTQRTTYETSIDLNIDIDFPPIIEADLKEMADALSKAKESGLIGQELAAQLFLLAANVNNIEEEIKKLLSELEQKKKEDQEKFEMRNDQSVLDDVLKNKFSSKEEKTGQKEKQSKDPKKDPVKEAIKTPAKNTGRSKDNLESKNNHTMQRMNAYRKALAGEYRLFQKKVLESIDISKSEDQTKVAGIVKNLDGHVKNFGEAMKKRAREYFKEAVNIGEKYAQKFLQDNDFISEISLFESAGRATNVLDERITWNDDFIDNSLVVDMYNKINEASIQPYKSEQEYVSAIGKSVKSFESRVSLYAGAFWTVEENAVMEASSGFGVFANYAGPLDEKNSPGCRSAVEGNPYPVEQVPIPGSFESGMNCRHAIQLITPER